MYSTCKTSFLSSKSSPLSSLLAIVKALSFHCNSFSGDMQKKSPDIFSLAPLVKRKTGAKNISGEKKRASTADAEWKEEEDKKNTHKHTLGIK